MGAATYISTQSTTFIFFLFNYRKIKLRLGDFFSAASIPVPRCVLCSSQSPTPTVYLVHWQRRMILWGKRPERRTQEALSWREVPPCLKRSVLWGMTRWLRQRSKQQKKEPNRVVEIKETGVEGDIEVDKEEITPAWKKKSIRKCLKDYKL